MIIRFNTIEVDLNQYEIRDNGQPLAVEPKVFDLIIYLIQHRQRIISRDELFQKIWNGREVSDTSLSNHIKTARKILGDNGSLQHVIKTIRSRGYQFIAKIEEPTHTKLNDIRVSPLVLPQSKNLDNKQSVSVKQKKLVKNNRSTTLIWATLLLSIFAIGFWSISSLKHNKVSPYLVVVPFSVVSNDEVKWEPFTDQITREIIQGLRKVSGINVVPPPSSFTFKSNKIRSHIKNQLPDVNYVLDGVISETNNGRIRITVELENINTGKLLWDGDFDVEINNSNLFAIQNNIATSVSHSLQVIMLKEEKDILSIIPTQNVSAYEAYVQGQHQFSLMTHESLLKSIEYFSDAIALDPNYEAPYIAKSNAYRFIMTYFDKPKDVLPKVISSSVDLLSLNPNSAQIKSSLGLAYVHAWLWEDAWKMLTKAHVSDPNIALTELGFALYYSAMGNAKGVKQSLAKAQQLDPLNEEIADWGLWALTMVNESQAAIAWGNEKIKLHPKNPYLLLGLSIAEYTNKNYEKSILLATKGVNLSEREPLSLIILAQSYAAAGKKENIQSLIDEAEKQNHYMCPYETAVVYALTGDIEKAFGLLDNAVEYQSNCLIFTRNDPRLSKLKHDKRYKKLLKTVELDDTSLTKHYR